MVPSDEDDYYWDCDLEPDERRDLERLRRLESRLIAQGAIKRSSERDYDEEDELERLRRMEEDLMAEMLAEAKRRNRPLSEKAFDFFTSNPAGQWLIFIAGPVVLFTLVKYWLVAPDYMGFWEWVTYEPLPRD